MLSRFARRLAVLAALTSSVGSLAGQGNKAVTQRMVADMEDTTSLRRISLAIVAWSGGTWNVDGEFKDAAGRYHKLTGYWAYSGEPGVNLTQAWPNTVVSLYLEPYAGGPSSWIGASLRCEAGRETGKGKCIAYEGAKELLDLNFVVEGGLPLRGTEASVILAEPEVKSGDDRWTSRTSSRGRFRLVPMQSYTP
jgi:hypothetical protein